jgi:hypothetical protein
MRNTTFIRTSGMFTRIVCACRHVRTCTHTRREGRGVYSYLKGEKYDGEWYADKMHGRGRYTYATGKVIDGVWRDDKPHGKGMYVCYAYVFMYVFVPMYVCMYIYIHTLRGKVLTTYGGMTGSTGCVRIKSRVYKGRRCRLPLQRMYACKCVYIRILIIHVGILKLTVSHAWMKHAYACMYACMYVYVYIYAYTCTYRQYGRR